MGSGQIILILVAALGVFVIVYRLFFLKKKGEDTPEQLEEYFSVFVRLMNVAPYAVIFEPHSNDGKELVYKEYTKTRNLYLVIERYRLRLIKRDNDGKEIFSSEIAENIYGGLEDGEWIDLIHELYVNRLSDQ